MFQVKQVLPPKGMVKQADAGPLRDSVREWSTLININPVAASNGVVFLSNIRVPFVANKMRVDWSTSQCSAGADPVIISTTMCDPPEITFCEFNITHVRGTERWFNVINQPSSGVRFELKSLAGVLDAAIVGNVILGVTFRG